MVEDVGEGSGRLLAASPVQPRLSPDGRRSSESSGRVKPVGVNMGNFGDTLRQEREFRGITLDAITRVTKISNRHLVALEQEHFDVLPGGVFNKSMVREYARVVGLDQEEWVARYLSAHRSTGATIEEDGWMRFAENASKARGEIAQGRRPDQRLRWMGIAVLLLLVAGLSWFVWSYVHKKMSVGTRPAVTHTTAGQPPAARAGYLHSIVARK